MSAFSVLKGRSHSRASYNRFAVFIVLAALVLAWVMMPSMARADEVPPADDAVSQETVDPAATAPVTPPPPPVEPPVVVQSEPPAPVTPEPPAVVVEEPVVVAPVVDPVVTPVAPEVTESVVTDDAVATDSDSEPEADVVDPIVDPVVVAPVVTPPSDEAELPIGYKYVSVSNEVTDDTTPLQLSTSFNYNLTPGSAAPQQVRVIYRSVDNPDADPGYFDQFTVTGPGSYSTGPVALTPGQWERAIEVNSNCGVDCDGRVAPDGAPNEIFTVSPAPYVPVEISKITAVADCDCVSVTFKYVVDGYAPQTVEVKIGDTIIDSPTLSGSGKFEKSYTLVGPMSGLLTVVSGDKVFTGPNVTVLPSSVDAPAPVVGNDSNDVTIPVADYVEYYNAETGEVVSGIIQIPEDGLTIKARSTNDCVEVEGSWSFNYLPMKDTEFKLGTPYFDCDAQSWFVDKWSREVVYVRLDDGSIDGPIFGRWNFVERIALDEAPDGAVAECPLVPEQPEQPQNPGPEQPAQPVVKPVGTVTAPAPDKLAMTGSSGDFASLLVLGAVGLMAVGGVLFRRSRRAAATGE